ncbi:hypothetical protein J6TS2_10890 [Heyndrickxia sporothermodurans]|nr:hypothetical protein J6TS2_10890 [Heyndrickxia sporothermodurans]
MGKILFLCVILFALCLFTPNSQTSKPILITDSSLSHAKLPTYSGSVINPEYSSKHLLTDQTSKIEIIQSSKVNQTLIIGSIEIYIPYIQLIRIHSPSSIKDGFYLDIKTEMTNHTEEPLSIIPIQHLYLSNNNKEVITNKQLETIDGWSSKTTQLTFKLLSSQKQKIGHITIKTGNVLNMNHRILFEGKPFTLKTN